MKQTFFSSISENSREFINLRAYHEAGHVVMILESGQQIVSVTIRRQKGRYSGYLDGGDIVDPVDYYRRNPVPDAGAKLQDEMMFYLAGTAAVELFAAKTSSGRLKAILALNKRLLSYGMNPRISSQRMPESLRRDILLHFQFDDWNRAADLCKLFLTGRTDQKNGLDDLYRRTKAALENQRVWREVEVVAKELMTMRTLRMKDISDALTKAGCSN